MPRWGPCHLAQPHRQQPAVLAEALGGFLLPLPIPRNRARDREVIPVLHERAHLIGSLPIVRRLEHRKDGHQHAQVAGAGAFHHEHRRAPASKDLELQALVLAQPIAALLSLVRLDNLAVVEREHRRPLRPLAGCPLRKVARHIVNELLKRLGIDRI